MRLLSKHYKHIYGRIIQDTVEYNAKLLILPAMTTDAICATKILCSILQQLHQGTTYTVTPVRGVNDTIVTIESFIEQLEDRKGLSIICIGHSGSVDLMKQFSLSLPERQNRIWFTVFDSNRPFNTHNLNNNNEQVRIILDSEDQPDTWDLILPLDVDSDNEDFFYTTRSQYANEQGYDEDNNNNDDDDAVERARRDYLRTVRGMAYDEEEDVGIEEEEDEYYNDEDDEDDGSLSSSQLSQDNSTKKSLKNKNQKDNYSSKRQRNRRSDQYNHGSTSNGGYEDDHDDNDDNVDVLLGRSTYSDEDEEDDYSHEMKRYGDDEEEDDENVKKSKQKRKHSSSKYTNFDDDDDDDDADNNDNDEHDDGVTSTTTKSLKKMKPSKSTRKLKSKSSSNIPLDSYSPFPKAYKSQLTWDQAVERFGREPMSRNEYLQAKNTLYSRSRYLTPSAVSLYNLAHLQRVQSSNLLWCALVGLNEAMLLEKIGHNQHQKWYTQLANDIQSNNSQQQLQNDPNVNNNRLLDPSLDRSIQFNRTRLDYFEKKNEVFVPDNIQLQSLKKETSHPALALEHGLTIGGMIETKYEFIFPYLRHWSLYDSLLNTPDVIIGFKLFRDNEGLKYLKQILAKLPIALQDSKRAYNLLHKSSLLILFRMIATYLSQYDINQVFASTFIIKVSSSVILSLQDFTTSMLQYLNTVICNCGDESHHSVAQSIDLLNHLLDSSQRPGVLHNNKGNNNNTLNRQPSHNQNNQNVSFAGGNSHNTDAVLAIGKSTCSFWPSYNLLTLASNNEHLFKTAIQSCIAQHTKINELATTLYKTKTYLKTHDNIHHCIIPINSILPPHEIPIVTTYYAMTQLAFRLQELILTRSSNRSCPFLLGIALPGTDYTLILGSNPIVKTPKQNAEGGIQTRFNRATYSQFRSLFRDAAQRMGVDYIHDSFEPNLIYVKNNDTDKFTQQLILLASRKEIYTKFFP